MDASLDLRKTKNIFYPLALHVAVEPTLHVTTAPQAPPIIEPTDVDTTGITSEPAKEKEIKHSNQPPSVNTDPPLSNNT